MYVQEHGPILFIEINALLFKCNAESSCAGGNEISVD